VARLILLNKPYQVLSQFTDKQGTNSQATKKTLAGFVTQKSVYPAGRLDYDSEGLLLLTDDGNLQHKISHPKHKLPKTYWVQVEGIPDSEAVEQLRKGVQLKDGLTLPAKVKAIEPPVVWDRHPPVRFRENIPTHWIEITISEGRNRQVRRMTAAVGLPTLRLIRYSIGQWSIEDLQPGESAEHTVHAETNTKTRTRLNSLKERNKIASSRKKRNKRV